MMFQETTVEHQHLHAESNILVLVQTRKNMEQKCGSGSLIKVRKQSKEKSMKTKGIVCNRSDGSNSGRLQSLLRPQSSYRLRNLYIYISIYLHIY